MHTVIRRSKYTIFVQSALMDKNMYDLDHVEFFIRFVKFNLETEKSLKFVEIHLYLPV